MALIRIFQRIGMVLTAFVSVEANSLTQRNIEQAHQLPGLCLTPGTGNESFQIHLSGADGNSTPAFKLAVTALFGSLQFPGAVEQRISRFIDLYRIRALADFIQGHQCVIVCGRFVRQPKRCRVPTQLQLFRMAPDAISDHANRGFPCA